MARGRAREEPASGGRSVEECGVVGDGAVAAARDQDRAVVEAGGEVDAADLGQRGRDGDRARARSAGAAGGDRTQGQRGAGKGDRAAAGEMALAVLEQDLTVLERRGGHRAGAGPGAGGGGEPHRGVGRRDARGDAEEQHRREAARDEDLAVGHAGRAVGAAGLRDRGTGGERVGRRRVDAHRGGPGRNLDAEERAGAVQAGDADHPAVVEGRLGVREALGRHPVRNRRPGVRRGVVDLPRRERGIEDVTERRRRARRRGEVARTAGDEDAAVVQERRGVRGAGSAHRSGRGPGIGRGIEDLAGRGDGAGRRRAAHHHHAAVVQGNARVERPHRTHRRSGLPRARVGLVELGGVRTGGRREAARSAAGHEDAAVAEEVRGAERARAGEVRQCGERIRLFEVDANGTGERDAARMRGVDDDRLRVEHESEPRGIVRDEQREGADAAAVRDALREQEEVRRGRIDPHRARAGEHEIGRSVGEVELPKPPGPAGDLHVEDGVDRHRRRLHVSVATVADLGGQDRQEETKC